MSDKSSLTILTAHSDVKKGDMIIAGNRVLGLVIGSSEFWKDKKGQYNQSVKIKYLAHRSGFEYIEDHNTSIILCPENDGHFKLLPREKKKLEQFLMLHQLENS